MRLKRLSNQFPPEYHQSFLFLDKIGIKTTDQFILTAPSTIAQLLQTINPTIDPHDFTTEIYETIKEACFLAENESSSLKPSESELEHDPPGVERNDESPYLSLQIPPLTSLFPPSYDPLTSLLELLGPPGSCRSLLALQIITRTLLSHPHSRCIWIDPELSFTRERARAIIRSQLEIEAAEGATGDDSNVEKRVEEVENRIEVVNVYDLAGLIEILGALGSRGFGSEERLILVIDPVHTFLSPILVGNTTLGHAKVESFLQGLKSISLPNKSKVGVILTTQTQPRQTYNPRYPTSLPPPSNTGQTRSRSIFPSSLRPALQDLNGWADLVFLLEPSLGVFGMDLGGGIGTTEEEEGEEQVGGRFLGQVLASREGDVGGWVCFHTDGVRLFGVSV